MDLTLLFRLIFAHFLCDFPLQSRKMVEAKNSADRGTKAKALALHSLIHAVTAYIAVWQWECWYVPVIMFATHFGIDWWKSTKKDGMSSFLLDQLMHIVVVVVLWLIITSQYTPFIEWLSEVFVTPDFWLIITAYLLMLRPSSILIALFIKKWLPEIEDSKTDTDNVLTNKESQSLANAGRWIGYLERTMILTFVLTGHFAAVGFLLAAKSIFRIGDLRPGRNLKLTEYILIGTFSSFFIAIIAGLIINNFVQ